MLNQGEVFHGVFSPVQIIIINKTIHRRCYKFVIGVNRGAGVSKHERLKKALQYVDAHIKAFGNEELKYKFTRYMRKTDKLVPYTEAGIQYIEEIAKEQDSYHFLTNEE